VSGITQASFRRPARRGTAARRSRARSGASERAPAVERERLGVIADARDQAPAQSAQKAQAPSAQRSARANQMSLASLSRWAPWLVLAAGAAAGATVAGTTTVTSVFVAALACACALLGWFFGESRRIALREEIEGRSSELKRALTELEIAQAETVRRLSMAVEFRDEDTGAHIERIGRFSTLLAEQIGMDPEFCERISHAAPLHDVGKVAIPDSILLKPGPLTPEERAIVETHAEEGYRLVRGSSSAILEMAATIALSHQEKWDGTGYPRGLAGEAIPIEGRIVAIADVFDALTSDRVYRKAFPVEEAVKIMREQRGRHFDPVLLDAFMEVLESSGADARGQMRSDPDALAESTLQTYTAALERGDAEIAEGAIAMAIDDGMCAATLHGEVIAPALRRIDEMLYAGELEPDRRQLAIGITRRVLATLYRYMLAGSDASRERVLVAGIEGDEHPLELQMMHDQLSAAGYRTILDPHVSIGGLRAAVESHGPDLVLLGASAPGSEQELDFAVRDLRASHGEIPIVLGGAAAGGAIPSDHRGMRVLERIDESVQAVEALLAHQLPAAAR
jgi:HD-GYP domain-containing protein (c-di-GMP phosphodiesterase class II)/methanogenic corrinoid protein MtbC1